MYYIDCLFRNNMSISHNSFKSDNEFEREKGIRGRGGGK